MHRNEKNSIHDLLKAAHANQTTTRLGKNWRNSVMTHVSGLNTGRLPSSDWERLAPRFTVAAAALSVLLLMTASVGLDALPAKIVSAYADQIVNVVPATLSGL